MYKTASPYIKELSKGNINWQPYTIETLNLSIKEDKMLFIHIGTIVEITKREEALNLFRNKTIESLINKYFIPIAIDTEDVPEAHLVALDLLIINEQKISKYINIFSLPGAKPFTSFSSLNPDDFYTLAQNVIESFKNKRNLLEKASKYLTERLLNTGVVTKKEGKKDINNKLLHTYVKSWVSRVTNTEINKINTITLNARYFIFILKYGVKYQKQEYINFIEHSLLKLYYSPMFDPIEGGVFKQAKDYTFAEPLFEKDLYENAQMVFLFTMAYKYLKKEIYHKAAERIIEFINTEMASPYGGYISCKTLNILPDKSSYYKYSLKELKDNFKDDYKNIAAKLGMDIQAEETKMQIISNTKETESITHDNILKLKQLRNKKNSQLLYDKRVITSYNCILASTLCFVARNTKVKDREKYISMAEKIIDIVLRHQSKGKIKLYRYISPSKGEYSYSDLYDYALFLNCLINILHVQHKNRYKILIRSYTAFILLNYYQPSNGMFSKSMENDNFTPFRRESVMDYTKLSANSIMARNLFLLYKITGDYIYINTFKQQLYNIEPQLIGSGPMMTGWGLQLLNYLTD